MTRNKPERGGGNRLPPLTLDDFTMPLQDSYSVAEIAQAFAVSQDTIRDIIARGELVADREGRSLRVTRDELARWFSAHATGRENP